MKHNILIWIEIIVFLFVINLITYSSILCRTSQLRVAFFDVGQGDSALIQTPGGSRVLIDTGVDNKSIINLSSFSSFWNREIDLVVPTHYDLDHVGYLTELISRYKVISLLEASSTKLIDDAVYESVQEVVFENSVDKLFLHRNDKIIIDYLNSVYLEVLWPEADFISSDKNDNSYVIRLVYNKVSFLFTGDISTEIEEYLVNSKTNLKSDVLKVGHHGSRTSSGVEFINIVNPIYSIISASKNNRFGHPHHEVVEILKSVDSIVLETSKLGNIVFETDGEEMEINAESALSSNDTLRGNIVRGRICQEYFN